MEISAGVERLVQWTQGTQRVWNCIECTRINHPTQKATPHQVPSGTMEEILRPSDS